MDVYAIGRAKKSCMQTLYAHNRYAYAIDIYVLKQSILKVLAHYKDFHKDFSEKNLFKNHVHI